MIFEVTNPPNVIANRGCQQIRQMTSQRGNSQLVTLLVFIQASVGSIPPVFVISKEDRKESLGLANPSCGITEETFQKVMTNFVKYVRPSEEHPSLILCDNRFSHITIDVITLAKYNHITTSRFTPHCSQRFQPVYVTFYVPFKTP